MIALSSVGPDGSQPSPAPLFRNRNKRFWIILILVVVIFVLLPALARGLPLYGGGPEHRLSHAPVAQLVVHHHGAHRARRLPAQDVGHRPAPRRRLLPRLVDRPARGASAVPAQGQALHVHAPARPSHRDDDDHAALPLRLAGQRPHRRRERPRHGRRAARLPHRQGALRRAQRPAGGSAGKSLTDPSPAAPSPDVTTTPTAGATP